MKPLLCVLFGLIALPALAGEHGRVTPLSPLYKSECGSCHTPYPPGLLPAADWRSTMAGLAKHFGTDASLDANNAAVIGAWLEKNAGHQTAGGREPRLTTTAWFRREHGEVPARVWRDARIKSPSNCSACHRGADQGRYGEGELVVPGLGRRED